MKCKDCCGGYLSCYILRLYKWSHGNVRGQSRRTLVRDGIHVPVALLTNPMIGVAAHRVVSAVCEPVFVEVNECSRRGV